MKQRQLVDNFFSGGPMILPERSGLYCLRIRNQPWNPSAIENLVGAWS